MRIVLGLDLLECSIVITPERVLPVGLIHVRLIPVGTRVGGDVSKRLHKFSCPLHGMAEAFLCIFRENFRICEDVMSNGLSPCWCHRSFAIWVSLDYTFSTNMVEEPASSSQNGIGEGYLGFFGCKVLNLD